MIYQVTAAGVRVEGTQTEWKGIVTSATAIGTLTLQAGTDQVYPIGSKVICTPTAAWGDDLVEGILVSHDQDGTLKAGAVDNAAVIADGIITPAKFTTALQGDWKAGMLPAVSSVTENGNRSADITFASTVASLLTPGMRIRTSRTVAAPTGAILLNGTTQYASKTTPAGMTFTDDFVVSAWVKLTSYQTGTIASRYNGTSGWLFRTESDGRLALYGFNAGAANTRAGVTYQSLPLNKWVHVAMQLDMSTYTATTTTIYAMIDGIDVPVSLFTSGTNPTALVQAGNLEIGSTNGGTQLFPGNIAQVAIFNAKVTQATIRGYKNQTLSGSESTCVAAYKLDQASGLNDLTANANNLTATGSPTYSTASPFTTDANGTPGGTYDYAIVTKVSTTVATVQYPEGCAIPTSGGISTVDYSGVKAPFGMPTQKDRWLVACYVAVRAATAAGIASSTVTNPGGFNLSVPTGVWSIGYQMTIIDVPSVALTFLRAIGGLSTSSSSISDYELIQTPAYTNASLSQMNSVVVKSKDISVSTATPYYFVVRPDTGGGTHTLYTGAETTLTAGDIGVIKADFSYL